MITTTSFDEVFPIWRNFLWPDRTSVIEKHSAMLFLTGFDLKNFEYEPTFLCYLIKDTVAGINSGHKCCDGSYRSRGLYVFPEYRGKGIGTLLLKETASQAARENCSFIWSYPRQSSWSTYLSAGFVLASNWLESENNINAVCRREL